jgi:hypothetical protein
MTAGKVIDHSWPSREEWAEQRRTPYYDRFEDLRFKGDLADCGSEAEIAAIIQTLRARWSELGRQMKTASKEPTDPRWPRSSRYEDLRSDRRVVNDAIKRMRDGQWPEYSYVYIKDVLAPLAPLRARYDAARKAAEGERCREIEATPIDDAAWEAELRRRANLDRLFGRAA